MTAARLGAILACLLLAIPVGYAWYWLWKQETRW